MAQPSLEFLCVSVASALLEQFHVGQPPVPIREILRTPPEDLRNDLGLTETLPYGDAVWVRTISGLGSVFANPHAPETVKRFSMAQAFFVGLCSSPVGQSAGLPDPKSEGFQAVSGYFARCLLMPLQLLPEGWEAMSAGQLAEMFGVPEGAAAERLRELKARASASDAPPAEADVTDLAASSAHVDGVA
jgi:hypothetical protein